MGFGLVIGFIEHLYTQLATTSNCSIITNSQSPIHYSTHLSLLSLPCLGARGSVVVKALCYKPEGCGSAPR
jgi:hypothetical protein